MTYSTLKMSPAKNLTLLIFTLLVTFSKVHAHAELIYPVGGEIFRPGDMITIKWKTLIDHGNSNWDLFYSSDGGKNWVEITLDIEEGVLEYNWQIPFKETTSAKIKVVQDNNSDADYESESGKFTISSSIVPGVGNNPDIITSVEPIPNIDKEVSLTNFPNPFCNQTTIHVFIPKKSQIRLSVISLSGKIVFERTDQISEAGSRDFVWENQGLSSGVYICRLQTDDHIITRKMLNNP